MWENFENKCVISGLDCSTEDEDLWTQFKKFGDIREAKVFLNIFNERCGYVSFKEKKDMEEAIETMNGEEMNGKYIKVEEAESPESKRARKNKDCYTCKQPVHDTKDCPNIKNCRKDMYSGRVVSGIRSGGGDYGRDSRGRGFFRRGEGGGRGRYRSSDERDSRGGGGHSGYRMTGVRDRYYDHGSSGRDNYTCVTTSHFAREYPNEGERYSGRHDRSGGGHYGSHRSGDRSYDLGSGGGNCHTCGNAGHIARECPSERTRYSDRDDRSGGGGRYYDSRMSGDHYSGYGSGSGGGACYTCGKAGHLARECPSGGKSYSGRHDRSEGSGDRDRDYGTRSGRCYKCGNTGHYARDCPNEEIGGGNRSGGGYGSDRSGYQYGGSSRDSDRDGDGNRSSSSGRKSSRGYRF